MEEGGGYFVGGSNPGVRPVENRIGLAVRLFACADEFDRNHRDTFCDVMELI